MTMRLVCDHCEGVISEAEFREVRHFAMLRDPDDPAAGTSRSSDETFHYHNICFESRMQAANAAQVRIAPQVAALPEDHPLRIAQARDALAHEEQIRVGADVEHVNEAEVEAQRRRERLEKMNVDELMELARQNDIEGRSDMRKAELVDALLRA